MRWAVAVVLVAAACKPHDPELKTKTHMTDQTVSRPADFPDLADPKPSFTVQGAPGAYHDALAGAIPPDPAGQIVVQLDAAPRGGDGTFRSTVKVHALWWRLPAVKVADATFALDLDYTATDEAALGRSVAEGIAKYLRETRPPTAAAPVPASPATAIAVGDSIACALAKDSSVHCWGAQAGALVGGVPSPVPIVDAVQLAAGQARVCARLGGGVHGGEVECVGRLADTPLDTAAPDPRAQVTKVCKLDAAAAIAAGSGTGCALVGGGRVACWPLDRENAKGGDCQHQAYEVAGVGGATSLAVGHAGGCALVGDQPVCWSGEQPDDKPLVAAPVPLLAHATAPLFGFAPCALDKAGVVRCTDGKRATVAPGSKVVLDPMWGCAIAPDATLSCWGAGDQVLAAPGLANVGDVSLGIVNGCAVAAGDVYCWGGQGQGHGAPLGIAGNESARPVKLSIF